MNDRTQQVVPAREVKAHRRGRRASRDVAQWQALIERHRGSGLTVRAFCARHDVNEASFYAWRQRLQSTAATQRPAPFVRLEPIDSHRAAGVDLQVRFTCGVTLCCPAECLAELVGLLKQGEGGSGGSGGSGSC